MPSTDILASLNLKKNPFCDRTAEKTRLDPASTYVPSDIFGFTPSSQTYLYFGRRGSGKTTIRMYMQSQHDLYNQRVRASGSKSKGLLVVDLTRPSTLTACLKAFQANLGFNKESWDSQFAVQGGWSSADFADCIMFAAVNDLLNKITTNDPDASSMLESMQASPRLARQFLVLAHVYASGDPSLLATLRRLLLPNVLGNVWLVGGVTAGLSLGSLSALYLAPMARKALRGSDFGSTVEDHMRQMVPDVVRQHPRLVSTLSALAVTTAAGALSYVSRTRSLARATALQRSVRVVVPPTTLEPLATVLDAYFKGQETADSVKTLCIGNQGFQKLELLTELAKGLGYEDVAIFMDGIDEVTLLEPLQYPSAIKAFAASVCRNEILNHGRVHCFFPDSRQGLDLNTEKINREARFDRHHVRDLTWSRHQLTELAERRFRAAQLDDAAYNNTTAPASLPSFNDMFRQIKVEDFSSLISKLTTPRELLICLTELLARAEASPDGTLSAQDLEIAVHKAMEQSV